METADAELVREVLRVLRARTGQDRDTATDGVLLADLARKVLAEATAEEAPTGEGATGEPYRIVLRHCPSCVTTEGVHTAVSETIVSEACCDAEIVDARPGPDQGFATRSIAPRVRRIVLDRDEWKCTVPGCENRIWLHIHHDVEWSRGGASVAANLRTLCGAHHRPLHDGLLASVALADGRRLFVHGDGRRGIAPTIGAGG
jgi:hypothetical protein